MHDDRPECLRSGRMARFRVGNRPAKAGSYLTLSLKLPLDSSGSGPSHRPGAPADAKPVRASLMPESTPDWTEFQV